MKCETTVSRGESTSFTTVSAYRIDAETGALTEIPGSPFATGGLYLIPLSPPVNKSGAIDPGKIQRAALMPMPLVLASVAGYLKAITVRVTPGDL